MHFTDRAPQGVFRLRDRDKVNVIGHQAISPNLHATLRGPLGHQLQVGRVVFLAEEGLLPTIPALRSRDAVDPE